MPLDEVFAYFDSYDKESYYAVACKGCEPSEDDLSAFEAIVGFCLPEEFRAFTMSSLGGLYLEVREELWRRPREFDVGPFWSFLYGIKVFGIAEDIPDWLDIRVRYQNLMETGVTGLVPFLCIEMPLEAADTAVDAQPLPGSEFMEILAKRQIELSRAQAEVLRRFLMDAKNGNELAGKLIDEASISFVGILPHIVNKDGCQPVLASLKEHPDVFLRFVANCGLAGSGDSDASEVIYAMLHDERLNTLDQRLLKTWALGAGMNPTKDDSKSILQHLMNLMGKGQKLKAGDECPNFVTTTQSGLELNFKKLKGRIIVLHFWSSSCAVPGSNARTYRDIV